MKLYISRNSLLKLFCIMMAVIAFSSQAYAITPAEALQKAKAKVAGASSLSASFSMKDGGKPINGKIWQKGKKFAITSNYSSNWYNGTDLYTYLPSKGETTIFRPTASELAETNPLMYIQAASNFNVMGSKTAKAGVTTVVLVPKKSGTGVKNVTIDLDNKTFLPKMIKLTPSSGGVVTINISGISLNGNLADSSFEYPKSKYPKAKIVDMR